MKLVLLFVLMTFIVATIAIPKSHRIQGVPYHRQQTDYSCGDASLQMVLEYWGPHVDQLSIIDVARTQPSEGTLSLDIVRTGKYSRLSSSVGIEFQNATTKNGFPGRPRGLAGFWHDQSSPWADEAFAIVAQDIPLILLMHYDPNGTTDGHFRVLIGYDYNNKSVTLLDPWDRDGNPRVLNWSFEEFTRAWNYMENPPTPRLNPFFGAALYPWKINYSVKQASGQQLILSATVNYPSFPPIVLPSSPASPVVISLALMDENISLNDKNQSSVVIPRISEGQTVEVTWVVDCNGNCRRLRGEIVAEGIVVGNVPIEPENSKRNYPGYDFVDVIGGHVVIDYKLAEESFITSNQ